MFSAVLFTKAEMWKQLRFPRTGERANQMRSSHTMGHDSVPTRNEFLAHVTAQMTPGHRTLGEISQRTDPG